MEDLASLGLAVDARPVASATESLDKLTVAGGKAEDQVEKLIEETNQLVNSSRKASNEVDKLVSATSSLASRTSANTTATNANTKAINGLAAAVSQAVTDAANLVAETAKLAKADGLASAAAREAAQARENVARAAREAAAAEREAAAAADQAARRVDELKASIDPLWGAQNRLNNELSEAVGLFRANAMSAADFDMVATGLQQKLNKVDLLQRRAAEGAKLHGHEMLNLTRQASDVGVTLAMGMNPLMVLVQQGPQIKETFDMAAARGMNASAVMKAFAASTWAAVAPLAPFIALAAGAAAVLGVGFAIATKEANDAAGDLTAGLGLTDKQLERLKESGESTKITFGDTFSAVFQVAGRNILEAFDGPLKSVAEFFGNLYERVVTGADAAIGLTVGLWQGGIRAVQASWRLLPAAIGDAAISSVNFTIDAINGMLSWVTEKVNKVVGFANSAAKAVGLEAILPELAPMAINRMANQFEGSMEALGAAGSKGLIEGLAEGVGAWNEFKNDVTEQAKKNAVDRILKAAGDADPNKASKSRRSEAEKELERLIKQAEDYIAKLKEETNTLGLNAIARKQYEIDQAAAKAPTEALTKAIKDQGKALIDKMKAVQADSYLKVIKAEADLLTKQRGLINATNRERNIELAIFEARQELVEAEVDLTEGWVQTYLDGIKANAEAQEDLNEGIGSTLKLLQDVANESSFVADGITSAADKMGNAFGGVAASLGNVVSIYGQLTAAQDDYKVKLEQARLDGDAQEQQRITKQMRDSEISAYGDMLGAAKGFFKEKSTGYKVMEGAEKAYRMIEFAMSAKSIATKAVEVATKLPMYMAETTAAATAGAAKMFAALGPFGFAAVAAMGVALAAWGFRGGGSGSGVNVPTSDERQASQGVGSVFGDAEAKSESLANSLQLAERYYNKDLEFSNNIVTHLRGIEDSMGELASAVVRTMSAGGALDASGLNLGLSGRAASLSNLGFGNTTNRTLNDQGLDLGNQTIGGMLLGGVRGNTFQEVIENTVKKAFGITYSNKTKVRTTTSALDSDLAGEIQGVIASLRSGVLAAASSLGLEGAEATIDAFSVNIGKISFKDMSGAEIQETLNAIFGKVGDDLAKMVGGGLVEEFQLVGEGALETLVRISTGVKLFDQQMNLINNTMNLTSISAITAKQGLVDLLGGLDEFKQLTDSYAENYLTEAERLAPVQAAVIAEMGRLGYASVQTKAEFKAIVGTLDLNTQAGRDLFAALMTVAPAFAKVADAADEAAKAALKALEDTLKAADKAVEDARATLRKAYEAELAPLQQRLDLALSRLTNAREGLLASYEREVAAIKDRAAAASAAAAAAKAELQAAYDAKRATLADKLAGATDRVASAQEALISAYEGSVAVIVSAVDSAVSATQAARANLRAAYEVELANLTNAVVKASERLSLAQNGVMKSYLAQVASLTTAQSDIDKQILNARQDIIASYEYEARALLDINTRFKAFSQTLKAFKEDLLAGGFGNLSPEEAYSKAKLNFESVSLRAASGDKDALAQLQGASQSFLQASREYYASGDAFNADFEAVTGSLSNAAKASDEQAEFAKAQLAALNNQLDLLDGVLDGIFKLGDQTYKLTDAVNGGTVALSDIINGGFITNADGTTELLAGIFTLDKGVVSVADAIAKLQEAEANKVVVTETGQAELVALNDQLDMLDGVKDGIVKLGDQTYKLVDGVFTLDNSTVELGVAMAELLLATEELAHAKAQVDALNALVAPLLGIDTTVASSGEAVVAAVAELKDKMQSEEAAKVLANNQLAALNDQLDMLDGVRDGVFKLGDQTYRLIDGVFSVGDETYKLAAGVFRLEDTAVGMVDGIFNIDKAIVDLGELMRELAASERERDQTEAEIAALDALVAPLLEINASVGTVEEAIANLQSSLLKEEEAKAQAAANLATLNDQLDMLDGVRDGIFKLGDQTYKLVDGVFVLDEGILSIADAITELALAEAEVAVAKEQVEALKSLVEPLLNIDASVISVRDAIAALAAATDAQAKAQAALLAHKEAQAKQPDPIVTHPTPVEPPREIPLEEITPKPLPDIHPGLGVPGKGGGGGGVIGYDPGNNLQQWLNDFIRDGGTVVDQRMMFAQGGVINRPMTLGEAGIGGEAGPEGILPLTRTGNGLGVTAKLSSDPESKALLKDIADELRKANRQRGAASTEELKRLDDLADRFDGLKREVARS